jgi:hypothetical protein
MKGSLGLTIRKIPKILALSWRDRGDLARAWSLLLVTDLGLRALPFHRLQKALSVNGKEGGGPVSAETIERLSQLVGIAARNHLCEMSCLRRSLVLQRMLSSLGIETNLQFGVNREDSNTINAHAWLEYEGQVIGESQRPSGRFASLVPQETHR